MTLVTLNRIEDIALNQLNRKNTFRDLGIAEVTLENYRFAFGLWPTLNQNTGVASPVPALIVWTPLGWKTLALSFSFWDSNPGDGIFDINIDVNVDGVENAEDLADIMWHLEGVFNPAISDFLAANPPAGEEQTVTVGTEDWDKIDRLLKTARFENGKLKFDWSL